MSDSFSLLQHFFNSQTQTHTQTTYLYLSIPTHYYDCDERILFFTTVFGKSARHPALFSKITHGKFVSPPTYIYIPREWRWGRSGGEGWFQRWGCIGEDARVEERERTRMIYYQPVDIPRTGKRGVLHAHNLGLALQYTFSNQAPPARLVRVTCVVWSRW